ncbi:nucleotidyltransferase domain-containing protein [Pseudorhizobium marinum]|uniref:nucleotidyltransferase domain-containing protein n=1 Tax=Pseudorhizobium marinum TaxID=1496690 RepID=UPI0004977039|nr:nucleotidyltransferase [Pseudorhizobium marinum]
MAVSESQLDTWSAQGSIQQSAATYKTVRDVLNDTSSPYYQKSFDTFLQGSYGNDTNIWADSDVDVVIRLSSLYYTDTSDLTPDDKARYDSNFSASQYSLAKFKEEVTGWLSANFGAGVQAGGKAIYIPGTNSRRDTDVLVSADHRRYLSYPATGNPSYREGIVFWMKDGTKIVNYPKQHSTNCTAKHQNTNGYFKPTVRIFKNMRNRMIAHGRLKEGLAPSYFLEGLLSNVPNGLFGGTYQSTVVNCINHILSADTSNFYCANGFHYLLRSGHPVCWSPSDFQIFMAALKKFWEDS